jgi:hypothetical protein
METQPKPNPQDTSTKAVSVQSAQSDESPRLAPEEHAWIEEMTGRTLTNDEAQSLLREAKLTASWEDIYGKRRAHMAR